MLFAVEAVTQINPWAQFGLVGVMCGALIGAVVWFMRHLLTTTFPTMINTIASELMLERGARAAQHQDNREDVQKILNALDSAKREVLDRIEREILEIREALKDNRHAIKNNTTTIALLMNALKRKSMLDDNEDKREGRRGREEGDR